MPSKRRQKPDVTLQGGFFIEGGDHSPATRIPLSIEDLLNQLTLLFRAYPGCESVSVVGVTPLDVPDSAGCNWSSSIVLDPAGAAPDVYSLVWAEVITAARVTWNLR